MGNSTPRVAEFTGRQDLHHGGLDSQGRHLAATDLPCRPTIRIPPIAEEVQGTLLMNDVK